MPLVYLRSYVRFLDGDEQALMDALSEDYPDEDIPSLNKSRREGIRRPVIFDRNVQDVNEVEAEMDLSDEYREPNEEFSELPVDEKIKNRRQWLYLLLIMIIVVGLIIGAIIYLP